MVKKITPIQRKKHEGAILARIDDLSARTSVRYVETRTTLGNYRHFVGCGYLNDDGLHHVEMMLGIMEGGR